MQLVLGWPGLTPGPWKQRSEGGVLTGNVQVLTLRKTRLSPTLSLVCSATQASWLTWGGSCPLDGDVRVH